MAVGPGAGAAGRVVEVTNGHVQIFDKTGATVAGPLLLDTFFSVNTFDPKVLFDEHTGRFYVVALQGAFSVVAASSSRFGWASASASRRLSRSNMCSVRLSPPRS